MTGTIMENPGNLGMAANVSVETLNADYNPPEDECAISPCLADAEKNVTCQYYLKKPHHACNAPRELRCRRCLTF